MTVQLVPNADRTPTLSRSLPAWVFNLALPVGFWAIALLLMPVANAFQFDTDEGQELVKALLYNQGYSLLDEIWSDQPPLLTLVLAAWLRLWEDSVLAARLLILGFSTVLVWAFAQLLRRAVDDRYALVGAFLLICTANFLRLSVSVMIGMPAIACLMVSLYALLRYHESRQGAQQWIWLGVASITAGLSMQFKMFTILLLPIWGLFLWAGHYTGRPLRWQQRRPWFVAIVWGLGAIATFMGLGLSLGLISLDASFLFHVDSDVKSAFINEHSLRDVGLFYAQEFDYFVLTLFALIPAISKLKGLQNFAISISLPGLTQRKKQDVVKAERSRSRSVSRGDSLNGRGSTPLTPHPQRDNKALIAVLHKFYPLKKEVRGAQGSQSNPTRHPLLNLVPLLWLVWVTLFLVFHKPIWYHHHILIALPLSWLATLGLKTCLNSIRRRGGFETRPYRFGLRPASLAVGFLLLAIPIKLTLLYLHNQTVLAETWQHQQVIEQIQTEAPKENWLFTDIPMYGVYTHRSIPPEIATLSRKRIAAQAFSAQAMVDLVQRYDLQQFVIGRFPIVEGFLADALPGQLEQTDYPVARYYRRIR
ncbi:MAG: glycosyltransferase family 39 protein [Cyanobacteria bacterium P01_G01_bin.54]